VARAEPVERSGAGWLLRFEGDTDIRALLPRLGELPTPPYIKRRLQNEAEYQTVFARGTQDDAKDGEVRDEAALDSAAAPTAGLHFTPRLLEALRAREIETAFLTLGVGVGTFRPVQSATLEEHAMHHEEFHVPEATAQAVARQRARGGRVVAVGTTATRVLESVADETGRIRAGAGSTEIFIRPGYRFRGVDALLTNFHLPRSTLLAMIGAFAGLDFVRHAYQEAIAEQYRFFSFGDAMLIE
jgi:S-adenosylmethionine:tRNA ribosyltransferase-isomerase